MSRCGARWRGAGLIRASAAGSVAFIGPNGPVFPSLLIATAVAGAPFSPLNYRLSTDGLAGLLVRLDRPLIVVDEAFENAVRQHDRVVTAGAWLSAARTAQEVPAAGVADEDRAVPLFTSGTTSRPNTLGRPYPGRPSARTVEPRSRPRTLVAAAGCGIRAWSAWRRAS